MVIFHKTEIQAVILRCLMSLNPNWYKSYDTKLKNSRNANLCFWTKLQKNRNGNISVLCHNFWPNQNLMEFRPVKHVIMTVWTSVLWKMIINISKKWPELVVTLSFIKEHSFRISLYFRTFSTEKTNIKFVFLTAKAPGWGGEMKIPRQFSAPKPQRKST